MASASAQVVGSATVGPEAISIGRSPGTSEMSSVSTRAGWQAAASRPPLMADRWRRTQFISLMVAPHASSARLTACLRSRSSPAAGSGNSAEPPPEIRHSTRSSSLRSRTRSSMRCAARMPAASGHRMRRFDDLDALARHGVAVARDHQPRQRAGPVLLDGPRHGRGRLAGADDDEPAARRLPADAAGRTARAAPMRWRHRTSAAAARAGCGLAVRGSLAHAPAEQRIRQASRCPSICTSTVEPSLIDPTPTRCRTRSHRRATASCRGRCGSPVPRAAMIMSDSG